MKHLIASACLAALLSGCAGLVPPPQPAPVAAASNRSPLTPASVCQDMAALQSAPDAAAQLNSLDPGTSALGSVWAYAKSGCQNGVPAAGVNPTWTQELWQTTLQLAPVVLPQLLPIILGLL